jgi:hypothetical protein
VFNLARRERRRGEGRRGICTWRSRIGATKLEQQSPAPPLPPLPDEPWQEKKEWGGDEVEEGMEGGEQDEEEKVAHLDVVDELAAGAGEGDVEAASPLRREE